MKNLLCFGFLVCSMLVVVPVHAQSLAGPYPVPGSGGGISPNYAGAVTFTNSANVFGGAFTGNGSGLTNLPASGGGVTNGSIIGASSYLPPFKIISPVIASNVLYVSTSGNDTTAQRGNPLLPYATVTNAVASASNNDVVYVYAGTYLVKSTVLPYGVSIIGDTNGVVSLVFNQPGLAAVAGLVLTNGGNTLANFTLSVTNTPTGYDTYPLYSGNAGLSGTVTSTATNIYLYNLKVNGYSDCIFVNNNGYVTMQAQNCTFFSYYDDVNLQGVTNQFGFTRCLFSVNNDTAPYKGFCPARGVAGQGATITVLDSAFSLIDGANANTDTNYNVAFSVDIARPSQAAQPTTFNSFRNSYSLSSTNCISQVFAVYLPSLGTINQAGSVFNTDFSTPVNAVATNYATINFFPSGTVPLAGAGIVAAGAVTNVSLSTNSSGVNGTVVTTGGTTTLTLTNTASGGGVTTNLSYIYKLANLLTATNNTIPTYDSGFVLQPGMYSYTVNLNAVALASTNGVYSSLIVSNSGAVSDSACYFTSFGPGAGTSNSVTINSASSMTASCHSGPNTSGIAAAFATSGQVSASSFGSGVLTLSSAATFQFGVVTWSGTVPASTPAIVLTNSIAVFTKIK